MRFEPKTTHPRPASNTPSRTDTVSRGNTCVEKGADLKYINKAPFYTVAS